MRLSGNLPFKFTSRAYESYIEWGKYMKEMVSEKKAAVLAGTAGDDLDLMVAMVKGANVTADPHAQTLSDDEILGNAFVFILAGHETTANSIHFSMALLAINIAAQRRLQHDLDEIFGERPTERWNYDQDVPRLASGMAGAVMNEELRLYAPVIGLPKSTAPGSPQTLLIGGKKHTIPGNTYIELITPATHRNPNQWPTGPPTDPLRPAHPRSNLDNDLEEFKPERWILDTEKKRAVAAKIQAVFSKEDAPREDTATFSLGLDTKSDVAANLYKPPKGAFIPFSEGYRSCIGKRFAQVELLAVLAVIFSKYSVELAVDEWASDEEIADMNQQRKKQVWNQARDKIENQMNEDLGSLITLQLRKGHFPLRLVERGSERFNF